MDEAALDHIRNPVARYLLAVRPGFLGAAIIGVLLGLAVVHAAGYAPRPWRAGLTLAATLLVHAGANVLNDYFDALSGADEMNEDRLYPFTGGSRFIQQGLMSPAATLRWGTALLALAALIGLAMTWVAGPGLLALGLAGLLLGWGYSAPPLRLCARGMGEGAVAVGFGVLIPLGTWYVQTGQFAWYPLLAGLPYGLLMAAVLFMNQFPDVRADAAAGKRHWVVRLGTRRARWGYPAVVLAAYGVLLAEVWSGGLPPPALVALLPAVLSLRASRALAEFHGKPARLRPAVQWTLAAALGHGVLLAAVLMIAGGT